MVCGWERLLLGGELARKVVSDAPGIKGLTLVCGSRGKVRRAREPIPEVKTSEVGRC